MPPALCTRRDARGEPGRGAHRDKILKRLVHTGKDATAVTQELTARFAHRQMGGRIGAQRCTAGVIGYRFPESFARHLKLSASSLRARNSLDLTVPAGIRNSCATFWWS